MGWLKDYAKGQSTKGSCGQCGHGSTGVSGCECEAPWCPCHRTAYGHGAHGCNERHALKGGRKW